MPVFSIITERDDLEQSKEFRKNSENSETVQTKTEMQKNLCTTSPLRTKSKVRKSFFQVHALRGLRERLSVR